MKQSAEEIYYEYLDQFREAIDSEQYIRDHFVSVKDLVTAHHHVQASAALLHLWGQIKKENTNAKN